MLPHCDSNARIFTISLGISIQGTEAIQYFVKINGINVVFVFTTPESLTIHINNFVDCRQVLVFRQSKSPQMLLHDEDNVYIVAGALSM